MLKINFFLHFRFLAIAFTGTSPHHRCILWPRKAQWAVKHNKNTRIGELILKRHITSRARNNKLNIIILWTSKCRLEKMAAPRSLIFVTRDDKSLSIRLEKLIFLRFEGKRFYFCFRTIQAEFLFFTPYVECDYVGLQCCAVDCSWNFGGF